MKFKKSTPEINLHEIGVALYGSRWQTDLANALGETPRNMRYKVAGKISISPNMVKAILELSGKRIDQIKLTSLQMLKDPQFDEYYNCDRVHYKTDYK